MKGKNITNLNIIHLLTGDESNLRYVRLDERNVAGGRRPKATCWFEGPTLPCCPILESINVLISNHYIGLYK